MGLAERINDEFNSPTSGLCAMARVMAGLSAEDLAAVKSAIELVRQARDSEVKMRGHTRMTAAAIRRALVDEGYDLSKDVVERHVYRGCGCPN
jgi:hypothetical protein